MSGSKPMAISTPDEEEEVPQRKYARIYFRDADCNAQVVTEKEVFFRSGITEKNIKELVKVVTDLGYHVSLYRLDWPEYFAETNK